MVLSLPEWIAALLHAEALISYWLVGAESNHLRLMLFSYHVKLGMTQFLLNEEKIRDGALQLSQVTGILFPAVSCALKHWARMLQDREMCLALSHTSEHAAGSAQEVDFTHACSSSKQKAASEHTCNRAGVCSFTSSMKVLWKAMTFRSGPLRFRIPVLSLQKAMNVFWVRSPLVLPGPRLHCVSEGPRTVLQHLFVNEKCPAREN